MQNKSIKPKKRDKLRRTKKRDKLRRTKKKKGGSVKIYSDVEAVREWWGKDYAKRGLVGQALPPAWTEWIDAGFTLKDKRRVIKILYELNKKLNEIHKGVTALEKKCK